MASLRATVCQVMGHPPDEAHVRATGCGRRDAQEQWMGRRLRLLLTTKRRAMAVPLRTTRGPRPSILPSGPVSLALTRALGRR